MGRTQLNTPSICCIHMSQRHQLNSILLSPVVQYGTTILTRAHTNTLAGSPSSKISLICLSTSRNTFSASCLSISHCLHFCCSFCCCWWLSPMILSRAQMSSSCRNMWTVLSEWGSLLETSHTNLSSHMHVWRQTRSNYGWKRTRDKHRQLSIDH